VFDFEAGLTARFVLGRLVYVLPVILEKTCLKARLVSGRLGYVFVYVFVVLLATASLFSQTSAPNRLWLSETIFPLDGFVIGERLQNPVFGITVGVIPGAMPVPVRVYINV